MFVALLLGATANAGPVTISTSDGASLSGEVWGSGQRGVLLVHDEGRSRSDWSSVAPRLASAGLQVLAIDLRGHGASGGGPIAEADWPKLEADVVAGVQWLTSHGVTELHVIGARLGAALALQAAAKSQDIDDLILLSPPAAVHGVRISTAAPAYGARPMLVAASADDAIAAKTATWLDTTAAGHHQVLLLPDAGAGAVMLNKVASLETQILGWLGGEFDPTIAEKAKQQKSVKSEVDEIETTGTRYEGR